ncbi:unnamed protein product [Effrenium voratum]|nr:unnamed protein product [Effrenium voratum]
MDVESPLRPRFRELEPFCGSPQALAAAVQPRLRVFLPRSSVVTGEERCNCADAGGVVWPTGECVDGATVLAQVVAGADGQRRSIAERAGEAGPGRQFASPLV